MAFSPFLWPSVSSSEVVQASLKERFLALFVISVCFLVAYNFTNWIIAARFLPWLAPGTAVFDWEKLLPFVPWMIVPYWTLDLFFVGSVFFCRSRVELLVLTRRIVLAILIAATCFLLFPLEMTFSKPEVFGIPGVLFRLLSNFDQPHNLVPSLHIALGVILWTLYIPRSRGLLQPLLKGWFIIIGLSAILTWQHHVIDVLTGYLLALFVIHLIPDNSDQRQPRVDRRRGINSDPQIAVRYALLFFLLILGTYFCWPYGAVLIWPAAAILIVGIAYAGVGPQLFRKGQTGYSNASRQLLAPFTICSYLSFRWFVRKQTPYVQLQDRMYFGQMLDTEQVKELLNRGVTAVVDLCAEYEEHRLFCTTSYLNVPVLDLTCPSEEQLCEACSFIQEQLELGQTVYVHCALGISRSAAVVAAYLLYSGQVDSVEQVEKRLKSMRPRIRFWGELRAILERFLVSVGKEHEGRTLLEEARKV